MINKPTTYTLAEIRNGTGWTKGIQFVECTRLHAAAPALLEACKGMLKAADELMTKYVSKKRAADWGVINQAMVDASAAIRAAAANGETP